MSDFISLAKYNGLSLMMWDSENYASENTKLASDFYKAGAQSQQQKIDEYAMVAEALDESYVRECKKNKELQKRIDDALSALESDAIGFSGLVHNYNKAEKILKGENHEY